MLVIFRGGPFDGRQDVLDERGFIRRLHLRGISYHYRHAGAFDEAGRAIFIWDPARTKVAPWV